MAWFNEDSQFHFGKYKGKKVSEVNDENYIDWLHHSNYNIYFIDKVLHRLGIDNNGKRKISKTGKRIDK